MSCDLVIGYGNTLRGDDGLGPRTAAAVAAWNRRDVRAIACHQLGPELAERISTARRVVFVDAAESAGPVRVSPREPGGAGEIVTHSADPRPLLGLAKALFGRCPPAWWVTIPASSFEFSEELSAPARDGLSIALGRIQSVLS